jgi:hypothetical protein
LPKNSSTLVNDLLLENNLTFKDSYKNKKIRKRLYLHYHRLLLKSNLKRRQTNSKTKHKEKKKLHEKTKQSKTHIMENIRQDVAIGEARVILGLIRAENLNKSRETKILNEGDKT